MNVFAKFDEIPSMILEIIKETKRYGRYGHTVGQSDNVKTLYPPTNTVCGGYKYTENFSIAINCDNLNFHMQAYATSFSNRIQSDLITKTVTWQTDLITQTCLCNILQYFTAVKFKNDNFQIKNCDIYIFLIFCSKH